MGVNSCKEGRTAYVRYSKGLRAKGKLPPYAYLSTQFTIDGENINSDDITDANYEDIDKGHTFKALRCHKAR